MNDWIFYYLTPHTVAWIKHTDKATATISVPRHQYDEPEWGLAWTWVVRDLNDQILGTGVNGNCDKAKASADAVMA